nr:hypothetical protein [uncultured Methanoregula sp.]
MKKEIMILTIILCLVLIAVPVIAAKDDRGIRATITVAGGGDYGQSPDGKRMDIPADNNTTTVKEDQRELRADIRENRTATTPNISVMREAVRESREESARLMNNASPVRAGWMQNENDVRFAVHTLLAMENYSGGIGPQVSAIARDFNNSANSALRLEQQIETRDVFTRMLFGGDQTAAKEMENITAWSRERIGQMQQLVNSTTLDAESRALMEEQIDTLNQNVVQWQKIAAKEQQDRGLFGWLK